MMEEGEAAQIQDDELTLPRSAVNKMIKELLPHLRVANNSRELVLNCCTEFILLLSSQSNEICEKRNKKTILPEHVIDALQELGFSDYVTDVQEVLSDYKTQASSRKKGGKKLEKLGISEEELLRQQQELFAQARQQHYEYELAQHNAAMAAAAASAAATSAIAVPPAAAVAGINQNKPESDDDDYD